MSKTVGQHITDAFKASTEKFVKIISWLNHRPKASLVLLFIAILYLPWAHVGHSYGSSFKHFFNDTLIVPLIKELGIRNDAHGWLVLISITAILLFLFKRFSKQSV